MLKLYHSPQSRSVRPRWMLEEIGAPYELVRINLSTGEQRKPEYLKLNPNGAVPTLVDGDVVLFESAAIVQYLADRFPEKELAPALGTPGRGKYYQWIHYAMSALEPPAVTIFLHTVMRPEAERNPKLVEEARPPLQAAVGVVDAALAGRPYVLGDDFSAADVMIGSTLLWCQMLGMVGAEQPNVQAYVARIATRPAMQRAQVD